MFNDKNILTIEDDDGKVILRIQFPGPVTPEQVETVLRTIKEVTGKEGLLIPEIKA